MENRTFDEKKHAHFLDDKPLIGTTTFLGIIAKPALIQWAADMATGYVKDYINQKWSTNAEGGADSFRDELIPVLEEARKAHAKKKEAAGTKGTDVHAQVEAIIKNAIDNFGGVLPLLPEDLGEVTNGQVTNFIKWANKNNVKFLASEKLVHSREWWVGGIADFTCIIDGKRYVGDLKTMKKMWDRVPFFQTATYMKCLQEMGEEKYDGSIIININKDTNELTEYYTYDCENDMKAAFAALTLYKQLNNF